MKRNHYILLSFLTIFLIWPMVGSFALAVTTTTYNAVEAQAMPIAVEGYVPETITVNIPSLTDATSAVLRVALFDTDYVSASVVNEAMVAVNDQNTMELPQTGDQVGYLYDLDLPVTWLRQGVNTLLFQTNVVGATSTPWYRIDDVAILVAYDRSDDPVVCDPGYEPDANGNCVPVEVPQCPEGYVWSEEHGVCLLIEEPQPVVASLLGFVSENWMYQVAAFALSVVAIYGVKRT